ncbi:MAG: universal stress protein [Pirellulaceae bacterium]
MLRSILVGLDGSPYSDAALEVALRWARRFGATLLGLGIVDEPTIRDPGGLMIGSGHYKPIVDEQHLADARKKVDQFLDHFERRCGEEHVACRRLKETGEPAREIVEEAQRCDLVVMGQQSYFHFETQEGPGETLFDVLRESPRPVITVPRESSASDSIALAYDGSLQAARATQSLVNTGLCEGSDVHVLTVAEDDKDAHSMAARAIEFLGYHGVNATLHAAPESDSTGDAILEQAAKLGVGLIAMGAYGKPAIQDFFFGSTTTTVLKKTTLPLLVYH